MEEDKFEYLMARKKRILKVEVIYICLEEGSQVDPWRKVRYHQLECQTHIEQKFAGTSYLRKRKECKVLPHDA